MLRVADMPRVWQEMTGTDPSWMPRVLGVLMEDYPAVWHAAVSQAVGRNAAEQNARRRKADAVHGPSSGGEAAEYMARVGITLADGPGNPGCPQCPEGLEVHSTELGCWLCDCTYGRVAGT